MTYRRGERKTEPEYIEQDCGYTTPCWVWQRALRENGYGLLASYTEGTRLAHRVYYERLVGSIPDGLHLDHLCKNRACVNPTHLEPVTCSENVRRSLVAKLSETDIPQIRALRTSLCARQIAERYGVSRSTISHILNGHTWVDV